MQPGTRRAERGPMVDIAGQQPSAPVPYRAVLAPHRSLGPRGFLILMCSLCAVSFGAGIAFWQRIKN